MVNLQDLECLDALVAWHPSSSDCLTLDLASIGLDSGILFFNDLAGVNLSIINRALKNRDGEADMSLEEYLERQYANAKKQAVSDFRNTFQVQIAAGTLLSNEDVDFKLNKNSNISTGVAGTNPFRFMEFNLRPFSESVVLHVSQAQLFKKSASQPINLYLYSDRSVDPIGTYTISTGSQLQEVAIPLDAGRRYWLGYYADDLDDDVYSTEIGCEFCTVKARESSNYTQIKTGYVTNDHLYIDRIQPDFDYAFYERHESFGLNVTLSVECDITPVVCEKRTSFARLIQLKGAADILMMIQSSTSLDGEIVNLRMSEEPAALSNRYLKTYNEEMQRITINWQGLDCECYRSKNVLGVMKLTSRQYGKY